MGGDWRRGRPFRNNIFFPENEEFTIRDSTAVDVLVIIIDDGRVCIVQGGRTSHDVGFFFGWLVNVLEEVVSSMMMVGGRAIAGSMKEAAGLGMKEPDKVNISVYEC